MTAHPRADLRPLTARSVVLSVLLGTKPPELPVRDLVHLAGQFDVSDSALRVALTRMVTAGDLERNGSSYRLSERLIDRQRRQGNAIHPLTTPWDGDWEIVAVTATGRHATDRAALRTRLIQLRLAELREGLWLRPANLARPCPEELDDLVQRFTGRPESDPRELARRLWDLDGWASGASVLLAQFRSATVPAERFMLAAAIIRILLDDPVLPEPFLAGLAWPAEELRASYREYRKGLIDLIASHRTS